LSEKRFTDSQAAFLAASREGLTSIFDGGDKTLIVMGVGEITREDLDHPEVLSCLDVEKPADIIDTQINDEPQETKAGSKRGGTK
jgi:hypothetical protein